MDALKKAAQLIRDKGWWSAKKMQGGIEAACAIQAITLACGPIGDNDQTYNEATAELTNRIKSLRAFSPVQGNDDYVWITGYNDSLSSPEPILELMEMDD